MLDAANPPPLRSDQLTNERRQDPDVAVGLLPLGLLAGDLLDEKVLLVVKILDLELK